MLCRCGTVAPTQCMCPASQDPLAAALPPLSSVAAPPASRGGGSPTRAVAMPPAPPHTLSCDARGGYTGALEAADGPPPPPHCLARLGGTAASQTDPRLPDTRAGGGRAAPPDWWRPAWVWRACHDGRGGVSSAWKGGSAAPLGTPPPPRARGRRRQSWGAGKRPAPAPRPAPRGDASDPSHAGGDGARDGVARWYGQQRRPPRRPRAPVPRATRRARRRGLCRAWREGGRECRAWRGGREGAHPALETSVPPAPRLPTNRVTDTSGTRARGGRRGVYAPPRRRSTPSARGRDRSASQPLQPTTRSNEFSDS